jgi:xanthine phosphoribosyltransferase
MLNQKLQTDFQILKINFRNQQQPIHPAPKLLEDIHFNIKEKTILLVEDRVKTGATLNYAKFLLQVEAKLVKTFAVNGKADYFLFDEECFAFPWNI